jgi:MYXO-CTERM domain-containing protein
VAGALIDTGPVRTDPSDDLNISPVTAVCSSCHDTERAKDHMILNGGTFGSLDINIAVSAVPEPGGPRLPLAGLGVLAALARRRLRRHNRGGLASGIRDERRPALPQK